MVLKKGFFSFFTCLKVSARSPYPAELPQVQGDGTELQTQRDLRYRSLASGKVGSEEGRVGSDNLQVRRSSSYWESLPPETLSMGLLIPFYR